MLYLLSHLHHFQIINNNDIPCCRPFWSRRFFFSINTFALLYLIFFPLLYRLYWFYCEWFGFEFLFKSINNRRISRNQHGNRWPKQEHNNKLCCWLCFYEKRKISFFGYCCCDFWCQCEMVQSKRFVLGPLFVFHFYFRKLSINIISHLTHNSQYWTRFISFNRTTSSHRRWWILC